MSGTYILWVNRGMGWEKRDSGSWDHIAVERRRFTSMGHRCLTTFCPPGVEPHYGDLLVHF